jgi:predicted nucleic acid-binding protein
MRRVPIWYLWRPRLRDRNDDMVLEAAANAAATHLVTFNIRDFGDAPRSFAIKLCQPSDLARLIRDGQE